MSERDIVERIKSLYYVHVPAASGMFREACDEIERLRAELDRLRLTEAEREAVEWFANYGYSDDGAPGRMAAILRGLLERLK